MTSQPDLFAGIEIDRQRQAADARRAAMPAAARARLLAVLGELRAADANPWPRQHTEVNQIIFRQMSNWLPPDERERLASEFSAELQRLNIPVCTAD